MALSQEEFFQKYFGGANSDPNAPKVPYAKFLEKNVPVQGIVVEVFAGTEYDPSRNGPKINPKTGEPKPQLTVTIKLEDGSLVKIGFKGSMLFSLRQEMGRHGLSALPVGALVGVAWTEDWTPPGGGNSAKQYTVKVKVG